MVGNVKRRMDGENHERGADRQGDAFGRRLPPAQSLFLRTLLPQPFAGNVEARTIRLLGFSC